MIVLSNKQMACITKRWFKKAEKQTFRTLPKFIKEISEHEAVNWDKTSGETCYEMSCNATAALALAWILRHPAKMQVITGTTSPERLALMSAGADVELTREEWYKLYMATGKVLP